MLVGLGMNVVCICVAMLNTATIATALFKLNEFPQWAVNATE